MKRDRQRRLSTLTGGLLLAAGILLSIQEGISMEALRISSPAFQHNESIPAKYTCDGADVNPPLMIENVPEGAKSLAMIVDDPDAPVGTWVHWVVWNFSPRTGEIRENSVPEGGHEGLNGFQKQEYGGPCPPSGVHRYFFKVYALDTLLTPGPHATKKDVERAMSGHIIAKAELVGVYRRR